MSQQFIYARDASGKLFAVPLQTGQSGGQRGYYGSPEATAAYRQQLIQRTFQQASGGSGTGIELVPGLAQTLQGVNATLTNLSSGTFWMRVGVGIVGLALVFIGAAALAQKPIKQAVQTVNPAAQIVKRASRR